jgi:hypothetical protein
MAFCDVASVVKPALAPPFAESNGIVTWRAILTRPWLQALIGESAGGLAAVGMLAGGKARDSVGGKKKKRRRRKAVRATGERALAGATDDTIIVGPGRYSAPHNPTSLVS